MLLSLLVVATAAVTAAFAETDACLDRRRLPCKGCLGRGGTCTRSTAAMCEQVRGSRWCGRTRPTVFKNKEQWGEWCYAHAHDRAACDACQGKYRQVKGGKHHGHYKCVVKHTSMIKCKKIKSEAMCQRFRGCKLKKRKGKCTGSFKYD